MVMVAGFGPFHGGITMSESAKPAREARNPAPETPSHKGSTLRVIGYSPLDGLGVVRLDLDSCPRWFRLPQQDPSDPDFPQKGPVDITIYLTSDRRWVEHVREYDPWEQGPVETFREVSPAYVIQELGLRSKQLPPDLAWLEPARDAMRKRGAFHLYGPQAVIEPSPGNRGVNPCAEPPSPAPPPRGDVKIPTEPDLGTVTPPLSHATTDGVSHARNDERKNMARDQVFISYSHKDKEFLDKLLTHLKPYLRKGTFTAWSDKQIAPGSQWFDEIKTALAKTSVAVMLVSSDFLASDFIHEHELGPLLKGTAAGGVTILWVLIGDCSYEETLLQPYQAVVSPPDKPFASMPKAKRDTAWKKVCQAIIQAVNRP